MSVVSYDGYKLQPAPFVSIAKNYAKTGNGESVGAIFNIELIGKIVAFKGSPTSSGTLWNTTGSPANEVVDSNSRLKSILRKQDAIRELFDQDGKSLEIQSADGSQPLKCNPRILSITFNDGIWYDICEYTISLEADVLYPEDEDSNNFSFEQFVSGAEENWSFEADESLIESTDLPKVYRVTHTISANGKRFYNEAGTLVRTAWQNAKNWVLGKAGFDATKIVSSGVNNLPSFYQARNHIRSETIDEQNGSFSLAETWVLASGTAIEDFNISTNTSADTGLTNVAIEGNIQGLEVRDGNYALISTKYANASGLFETTKSNVYTRAKALSGVSLNILPVSTTIGRNQKAGTINYTYNYNNRPAHCFPGVKSESVVVTDSLPNNVFAAVGVLGRAAGPVLQDIGTRNAATRSLNVEIFLERTYQSGCTGADWANYIFSQRPSAVPAMSSVLQTIVDAVNPGIANEASFNFTNSQNETWEPLNGHYSYSIEWTYEL